MLLSIGGCGASDPSRNAPEPAAPQSGERILRAAAEGGYAAGSVTAEIRALIMGQGLLGPVSVDRSGRCAARLEIAKRGRTEFLTDGEHFWLKGGEQLWGPNRASRIGDRYVTGAVAQDPFNLAIFCQSAAAYALLGSLEQKEMAQHSPAGAASADFVDPDGSVAETADAAAPRLTRYRSGNGSEPFDYRFSDYGRPVAFEPPPSASTVALAEVLASEGSGAPPSRTAP
ncbi:hypothetical protein FB465_7064 [Kitasatospora atroaurantiaca]|uniref:Lipoprotein n=1 Tax=Kitasatospora atroaurantiaca TaxID=285545 RepID=A0A561F1Y4_9ACTN|nr:hypothetical protein FB465_7064 [Kitasatospora atroaurantiaca]